jgi:hypothetical protein
MTAKKPDTHGSDGMKGTGWKEEIINEVLNIVDKKSSKLKGLVHYSSDVIELTIKEALDLAEEHFKPVFVDLAKAVEENNKLKEEIARLKRAMDVNYHLTS